MSSKNLGNFWLSSNLFSALVSLSSPSVNLMTEMTQTWTFNPSIWGLRTYEFFFQCFNLWYSQWIISINLFKLLAYFFIISTIEPIKWLLNFRYYIFFNSKFLFFSVSLWTTSIFPFISRLFTLSSWSVVVMDVLKSFSNNLNIWIISRLTLLSFLLGLGQIFLVFSMPSNMGLYPGHFEYYVMNHWVILNPLEKLVFFSPLFLCFQQAISLGGFCSQALSHFLWLVVPMSVSSQNFAFLLGSALHTHPSGSVWGPGGSLYCSSVLKAPLGLLHTCVAWGWDQDLY